MSEPGAATPPAATAGARFTLRPANGSDASALCSVHARAIRALAGKPCAAEALEAWAARARPETFRPADPARRLIVAEAATPAGPRVAGYAQLHLVEGTIEALYVDPDFARQGVGGLLVRALEREGRNLGLPGLIVDALPNAVPFYRALGYVAKGTDRHSLAPGVDIDCTVMEKRLRPGAPAR